MRPLIVVMQDVLSEHSTKVALRDDQHPVQALAPAGPNPPLGVSVGARRHKRGQDHLGPFGADDVIESTGELPIMVMYQQAQLDPEGGQKSVQLVAASTDC